LRVTEADAPTDLKASPGLVVRVIDLKKLREGPEFSEEGPLENLSQMETKLAWLLLRELAPDNAPSEEAFFHDRAPARVDAMENYVRGLMASNDGQKMKLFTQAARLDDHFSEPNVQLGRMLFAKQELQNSRPMARQSNQGRFAFSRSR
jgi:hypothetical protein